ncbi:Glycerophosphoryl diester phosphodiesterase [Plesiocystis pacifica SIR-1]|uniref:glycerophosphodiester phosphodiesterase n=1 Tax=Plesiocystis pacifica SIR-1 TaxID=391625 RepID=A6GAQ6_9BACT|nr:glycerophosphodiester phosphodiesterase family protein [Plesiocystis pacifica]EDM76997.1 Glycerophosphoryl diester phosphodiesterase [Plesiocystis pacifica SIR-1]
MAIHAPRSKSIVVPLAAAAALCSLFACDASDGAGDGGDEACDHHDEDHGEDHGEDQGEDHGEDQGEEEDSEEGEGEESEGGEEPASLLTLGPRPLFLVEQMADSVLKDELLACADRPVSASDFSIGHRGAPLMFPEHTRESYEAAARMGAGVLECDVTFTKDRELVCRHSQCDLHTTTNILAVPELAAKCTEPFVPADPEQGTEASAMCCASDITLAEFHSLCGKMDGADPTATTVEGYLAGTANWRTDLYSTCGTLLSHAESVALFDELGVGFTPELKAPQVEMPYEGDYTQEAYAQQLIDEYVAAGIAPERVWAQSFELEDVLYWLAEAPEFGAQAVFLDDEVYAEDVGYEAAVAMLPELAAEGVNIVAPPMFALVELDGASQIVPSAYALEAKAAGLDIITWTLERSGPLNAGGGWYYQTTTDAIDRDGDAYELLDVLAQDVGVLGVFSDWPATTTYYANCKGL